MFLSEGNGRFDETKDHHWDYIDRSGCVGVRLPGITYTTREKVVDIGPIHLTAEKTRTIPLPPIVGAVALVGGIVVLVMASKKG